MNGNCGVVDLVTDFGTSTAYPTPRPTNGNRNRISNRNPNPNSQAHLVALKPKLIVIIFGVVIHVALTARILKILHFQPVRRRLVSRGGGGGGRGGISRGRRARCGIGAGSLLGARGQIQLARLLRGGPATAFVIAMG